MADNRARITCCPLERSCCSSFQRCKQSSVTLHTMLGTRCTIDAGSNTHLERQFLPRKSFPSSLPSVSPTDQQAFAVEILHRVKKQKLWRRVRRVCSFLFVSLTMSYISLTQCAPYLKARRQPSALTPSFTRHPHSTSTRRTHRLLSLHVSEAVAARCCW
jgi:hypothetical protein